MGSPRVGWAGHDRGSGNRRKDPDLPPGPHRAGSSGHEVSEWIEHSGEYDVPDRLYILGKAQEVHRLQAGRCAVAD